MSDDRFAERRRSVVEDRARRYLKRTMLILIAAAAVAGGAFVLTSPLLSVDRLEIEGVQQSATAEALDREGIILGEPLIFLDLESAADEIRSDPWVLDVAIDRRWPTTVIVEVVERVPVAVVGANRDVVAADGVVLPSGPTDLPTIALSEVPSEGAYVSQQVLGALQFVDALAEELRPTVRLSSTTEGLVAQVRGYYVRLGRPVDMVEKARALGPVIDRQPPDGAEITLIAPSRPSVLAPDAAPGEPEPEVEG